MVRLVPSASLLAQGSWRAKEALWIAMEYCSGGSISDIMAATDAPLDEDLIAYVCRETLAGLVYLHSMGKARRAWLAYAVA